MGTDDSSNGSVPLRRMRRAQIRLYVSATAAIVLAASGVAFFSPQSVGEFAFHSITFLLLIYALISVIQFNSVIHPLTKLIGQLESVRSDIRSGVALDRIEVACSEGDEFSDLAAAIDAVFNQMINRARINELQLRQVEAVLDAVPMALVIFDRNGKVLRMLKDQIAIDLPERFTVGEEPDPDVWGAENVKVFEGNIRRVIETGVLDWRTFSIKTPRDGVRRYNAAIQRMNDFSALLVLADITDVTDPTSEHQVTSVKTETGDMRRRAALRSFACNLLDDVRAIERMLKTGLTATSTSEDPETRRLVEPTEQTIKRVASILDELTWIAGTGDFNPRCVNTRDTARELTNDPELRRLIPKNIELIDGVSDDPMPMIDLDMHQARLVVKNIVMNAVEAIGNATGRIWIKFEPFTMTEENVRAFHHAATLRLGSGVLITVVDDGPGMPEEVLTRAFDPYFTTRAGHRGVGLSTTASILDQHGGAVCLLTKEGAGSTFHLWVPVSRNTPEEIDMMRKIAPNGEILLVDDDPMILHTTSLVLRTLGVAAHPASDEESALVKLRSLRTRLRAVVLEGAAAGFNAPSLAKSIRHAYPSIKIIVASCTARETIEERFRDTPFDAFLTKPYSCSEIDAALKAVAARS